MEQKPAAAGNAEKTAIHEEVEFKASPAQIYAALLDAKQFAALTGAPAVIDAKAGGAFSLFGGQIEGRTVELVENVRVVQAWRPANWTAGDYSLVEFQLKPQGTGTLLIFDHKGFPKGDYDHLLAGWHEHYWAALKKV
jgi:activator of HSP90 ATPase